MIRQAIECISFTIQRVSGLDDFNALVVAYYCLATWFVKSLNQFPILSVLGSNGTGKTQLLNLLGKITFRPYHFTATGITSPVLRDKLAEAHDGTAIIDEADTNDHLEEQLSTRYLRSTAATTVNVSGADGKGWNKREALSFGASIVHKRVPYKDPALEGRSVSINTVLDQTKQYVKADDIEPDIIEDIRNWEQEIAASATLTDSLDIPDDIAPRVADTYQPLVALASAADDQAFLDTMWSRLRQASENLKDGQLFEPRAMVLQALIMAIMEQRSNHKIKAVQIETDIKPKLYYSLGLNLNNHQIKEMLTGFGFDIRRSGGSNAVFHDINTLVRACDSIGLEDEAVEQLAAELRNAQQKIRRVRLQSG